MRWSKKDIEPEVVPSPAKLDPFLRLGAAMVLQATKEAAKGSTEAAEWLAADPVSLWVCEVLELQHWLIMAWLKGPRRIRKPAYGQDLKIRH